jgi:hypothetical protein
MFNNKELTIALHQMSVFLDRVIVDCRGRMNQILLHCPHSIVLLSRTSDLSCPYRCIGDRGVCIYVAFSCGTCHTVTVFQTSNEFRTNLPLIFFVSPPRPRGGRWWPPGFLGILGHRGWPWGVEGSLGV